MAIEWADNFQNYGVGSWGSAAAGYLTNGAYEIALTSIGNCRLVDDPDPNISTTVLEWGFNNGGGTYPIQLRKVYRSFENTKGFAFRLWLSGFGPNNRDAPAIFFQDAGANTLLTIMITSQAQIQVFRGAPGTPGSPGVLLGQTAGPVLIANGWQHWEVRYVSSTTVGAIEIRIEGQTVLTLSGINSSTTGNAIASVNFRATDSDSSGGQNGWPTKYLKDFVLWNALGAYNTTFLGPVGVFTLRPASDIVLNWTPVGGSTGWDILDVSTPNDSAYIQAGSTPIPGNYRATLTDLPADITAVRGLMSVTRSRKSDAGTGQLQVGIESGASVALGANRAITTSFTYWSDISEENPATVTAWTPATVNAAGLRINRTV